jgi:MFS family permease
MAPAVEPPAAPSTTLAAPGRSLWHNHDFLRFWAGETLSLYGTQVTLLALPLTAVLIFDASPQEVGLLRFLQLIPYLAFALLFGVWVDRARRRPVMIAANAVRMVLIGLVPTLAWLDRLTLGLVLVIAFAIGTASVLFDVSWMSYVPALVRDSRQLVEANAKLGVTSTSADTAGPGVAGALVGALTAPTAMVVDAVSYLVSLVSLMLIRTPEPVPAAPASATGRRRLIPELAEGLRWVFGNVYLRFLALVGAACNFFSIATATMFLVYAVRERSVPPAELGVILSCGAAGGLSGSLVSAAVLRRFPIGSVYFASLAAVFAGPLLVPLAGGPRPLVVGMFIASFFISYFGLAISNVLVMSLRQTMTPPNLMGRMNAAMRTLMFGGGALGGPAGGALAGMIGLHGALWAIGIGAMAMLVPVFLSPVSRLREMPPAPGQ